MVLKHIAFEGKSTRDLYTNERVALKLSRLSVYLSPNL